MNARVTKKHKGKRKKYVHPLDRNRLLMDSIYGSERHDVKNYFRQVMEEEETRIEKNLERGERWVLEECRERVHMRMGVRFFHMLSSVMQRRFVAEYPTAFTMFADECEAAAPVLAKAV